MRVTPTEGPIDLRGHTLVLPGVGGLAHLGELAVDAVVASLQLHRAAFLHSRHLLPVAMASAWEGEASGALALTTAAELYQSPGAPRLSVLQLRAPVAEGRRRALAGELLAWARAEGVAELVVLASCSSHVKTDADLSASTELRYVRAKSEPAEGGEASVVQGMLPLGHGLPAELSAGTEGGAVRLLLRGSGLARALLLLAEEAGSSPDAQGLPSVLCLLGLTSDVLSWPVMEQLARAACASLAERHLGSAEARLLPPPSWHHHAELMASPQRLWG